MARPATNVSHTSSAPAIGVSRKIASNPPTAIKGARRIEKPGAHTGADTEGFVSDVTNPPGVNVFPASGHGTCATRSLAAAAAPPRMHRPSTRSTMNLTLRQHTCRAGIRRSRSPSPPQTQSNRRSGVQERRKFFSKRNFSCSPALLLNYRNLYFSSTAIA